MIYVRQTYGPKDFSKTGEGYEKIMSIIECTLSFLILRSLLILCVYVIECHYKNLNLLMNSQYPTIVPNVCELINFKVEENSL